MYKNWLKRTSLSVFKPLNQKLIVGSEQWPGCAVRGFDINTILAWVRRCEYSSFHCFTKKDLKLGVDAIFYSMSLLGTLLTFRESFALKKVLTLGYHMPQGADSNPLSYAY